jgi:hypothetical protein
MFLEIGSCEHLVLPDLGMKRGKLVHLLEGKVIAKILVELKVLVVEELWLKEGLESFPKALVL